MTIHEQSPARRSLAVESYRMFLLLSSRPGNPRARVSFQWTNAARGQLDKTTDRQWLCAAAPLQSAQASERASLGWAGLGWLLWCTGAPRLGDRVKGRAWHGESVVVGDANDRAGNKGSAAIVRDGLG